MLELIKEYLSCAKYSCELLKDTYPSNESLLRAKVLGIIPKDGIINDVYYRFHGRGCIFKYSNDEIDVDFGPGGRYDGFDMHRLKKFLKFREDRFKDLLNDTTFNSQFNILIKEKIIYKLPNYLDDHLYYLDKSV